MSNSNQLPKGFYPTQQFSVNLDRIEERAKKLKPFLESRGLNREFVIFQNGTVIAVPEDNNDSFDQAKEILNFCMSNHPDFSMMEEPYDDLTCCVLLMSRGLVSTYLFSDEWNDVKNTLSRDEMLCQSEVLSGEGWEEEEIKKSSLFTSSRIC